jgi:hypothetical protein
MLAQDTTPEEWRPVPGYKGLYEASSHGTVRSLDREVIYSNGRKHIHKGRRLRGSVTANYWSVQLCRQGIITTTRLHKVVLLAFHGSPKPGHVARHMDGDSLNNRADNLRWGTRAENEADKARHGTRHLGERHHHARLTAAIVGEIRASALSTKALATHYGVSEGCIYAVRTRRTWRHL